MSPLSLNLRVKLAPTAARTALQAPVRVRFSTPNIGRGLMPARGLVYSFVVHQLAFACLLVLFVPLGSANPSANYELARMIDLSKPHEVMYLPAFGGGSEGKGHEGGQEGTPARGSEEGDKARKGFTYSGPQHIVSHPKNPTNDIQTILQPELVNPPVIKQFMAMPNIVQTAAPKAPDPPAPVEAPKKVLPDKIQAPKQPAMKPAIPQELTLPSATPISNANASLTLPLADPDEPTAPRHVVRADKSVKSPTAPHRTESVAAPNFDGNGTDARTLVALSPMPSPAAPASPLPFGEARGEFAISPELEHGSAKGAAGSPSSIAPAGTIGAGGNGATGTGNSAGESAHGTSTGSSVASTGGGGTNGAGTGTSKDVGTGNGGAGAGSARGSGTGPGAGNGLGLTIGNGSGNGAGPGHGNFAGLTIRGGELETGMAKTPDPGQPIALPQNYALTVAGTASSGGGLGDFGVFSNEKVYTVYIDMRRTTAEKAPAWVLQFAPAQASPRGGLMIRGQEGVVPPLPIFRPSPEFPDEMLQKFERRMVVIAGTLESDGKLSGLTAKQSPDDKLSELLMQVLSNWEFRPARLNGEPVKIKVLFGIPLPTAN